MNYEFYISLLERSSIPGALIIIAIILYKGGVVEAIAHALNIKRVESDNSFNQVNIKTNDSRIRKLEEFQLEAETNHWHDIEGLMEDVKEMRTDMVEIRDYMHKVSERLAIVETKLIK